MCGWFLLVAFCTISITSPACVVASESIIMLLPLPFWSTRRAPVVFTSLVTISTPFASILPSTSSLSEGVTVPMPTRPSLVSTYSSLLFPICVSPVSSTLSAVVPLSCTSKSPVLVRLKMVLYAPCVIVVLALSVPPQSNSVPARVIPLSAVYVVSVAAIVVSVIVRLLPTVSHLEAPAESSQNMILSAFGSVRLSIPRWLREKAVPPRLKPVLAVYVVSASVPQLNCPVVASQLRVAVAPSQSVSPAPNIEPASSKTRLPLTVSRSCACNVRPDIAPLTSNRSPVSTVFVASFVEWMRRPPVMVSPPAFT